MPRGIPNGRAEEVRTRRRNPGSVQDRGLKLSVPKDQLDPNFTYRWANDDQNRLHNLTAEDDYDIVSDPRHEIKPDADSDGTPIAKLVGTADGRPMKGYLLRKPTKYYKADRKEAQKPVDELDEQIRAGLIQNTTTPGLAGVAYTPGSAGGAPYTGRNEVEGR